LQTDLDLLSKFFFAIFEDRSSLLLGPAVLGAAKFSICFAYFSAKFFFCF